jgi:predicted amidohydrolase YtcJ
MRFPFAALTLALIATPAHADGLIDNVKGYTIGADGTVVRFAGLLLDDRGRVAKLLGSTDRRPEKLDFRLDGKGRTLVPGLVRASGRLVLIGLARLVTETADPRAVERMTAALATNGEGLLPRERDAAIVRAQELLLAEGVTSFADIGTTANDWNALRRAGDEGRLRLRITSYAAGIDLIVSVAGARPTAALYDGRLRMAGVALEASGDPADDARLRNLMSRAAMDGFQISALARSPAARAQAIAAFEELGQTYDGDRRWRLDGDMPPTPEESARLTAAGGIAVPPWRGLGPLGDGAVLAGVTSTPARAIHQDGRIGRIAPGFEGDFLLAVAEVPDTAPDLREVWIGGKRVTTR